MCGCEHHRDHNAPCTCTCPDHKAVRAEMSRTAPMSATDHTLTAPERENIEELLRLHVLADDEQIVYDLFETLLTQRGVTYEARLATAEAEKEALRERVEYVRRDSNRRRVRQVRQLQGRLTELAGVAEERGYDVQAQMERAEAAEAALADLRAIIPADATTALDAVKAQAAREALLAAADDYERERIERHEIVIAALDSKYDNGVVSGPAKFLRARADQIGGAK